MSIYSKFTTIALIVGLTLAYAFYERDKISKLQNDTGEILQTLPNFTMFNLQDNAPLSSQQIIQGSKKGAVVHFWGTWCAPCEKELPSFIKLAEKFQGMGLNFYLVAVKDKPVEVKKFLKRFKNLPSNIKVTLDPKGVTLPLFGTVKVPETYLFDQMGKHLVKFIGPQDWEHPDFFTRIVRNVEKSFTNSNQAKSTNE